MPYVTERTANGERTWDLMSRMMAERVIMLGTDVNSQSANMLVTQLLYLEAQDSNKPIYFYINSPGGSVYDGMAVYDTMQHIKAPIHTICVGMAASMGSFLLAAGSSGLRAALPNARIMIHQPSGGSRGTAADIEIQAREIVWIRERMNGLYAVHTGRKIKEIEKAMDRDNYMSPEDALAFGLIDKIIEPNKIPGLAK